MSSSPGTRFERRLLREGFGRVAGVDEAGRGPLAGPVVAAAVIMPPDPILEDVADSKVLSPQLRTALFEAITRTAVSYGIGVVDHTTIDRINILRASFLAMERAISHLEPAPDHLLIDGNRFVVTDDSPYKELPYTLVVDGDALSYTIGAASILAKVTRDRIMESYDVAYPGYGFARHKGYSTPEHREAIFQLGFCEIHRRSFSVKEQLELPFQSSLER